MIEDIKLLSAIISTIILLFVLAIILSSTIEFYSCKKFAELNHTHQVEYKWPIGCMVKVDGIWLQDDKLYYDTNGLQIAE